MVELKQWIEAQLKRGYSRKQIKEALIKKGYSPKAVAEVDKAGYSALPANKLSYKAIALAGIIIVLTIWLINAMPFFPKQPESTNEVCKDFSNAEGEVSCEEAIELALAEYPGAISYIDKAKVSLPDADKAKSSEPDADEMQPPHPPTTGSTKKDVWLIGISLEEAIKMPMGESKNIEVIVGRIDKTLRLYKFSKE